MLLSARSMLSAGLRTAVAAITAALVVVSPSAAVDEVRALWVVRTSLTSPAAIATMVASAKAGGFNTLLVQVRGRGDAYYQHALEPRPVALATRPDFDPLATVIERAHAAGLHVHAWMNMNLVVGVGEMPVAREHVAYRHPEWLMVPRALADDLVGADPRSPGYLGRLVRHARAQSDEIEGLYLSPVSQAAVDYTVSVVRDVVDRYALDGIHLDYVRYPSADYDYSRDTLAAFRRLVLPELAAADRQRYDARVASGETVLYTRAFPERWRAFRADRLTELVSQLHGAIKTRRPSAIVSAAVAPDPVEAADHRLQNWRTWLDRDLVDVICPMAYTTDPVAFATQIDGARQIAGAHPVWAGIGAYRLTSAQITAHVRATRRLGAAGVILFSYDSLINPARGPDYLAQIGRAAFMQ
jgi:uncharacterized lipoprotein YddW (UPF0748 family)